MPQWCGAILNMIPNFCIFCTCWFFLQMVVWWICIIIWKYYILNMFDTPYIRFIYTQLVHPECMQTHAHTLNRIIYMKAYYINIIVYNIYLCVNVLYICCWIMCMVYIGFHYKNIVKQANVLLCMLFHVHSTRSILRLHCFCCCVYLYHAYTIVRFPNSCGIMFV